MATINNTFAAQEPATIYHIAQNTFGITRHNIQTIKTVQRMPILNTGAKIHIGLDCIKTLSIHHGVMMPVFVDNAESVTNWLIDMDNQMIRLVAMPNVEKLEVING